MAELIDRHWRHLPDTEVLDLLGSEQDRGLVPEAIAKTVGR